MSWPLAALFAARAVLTAFFFAMSLLRGHVLRPRLHLVAHGRFRSAAVGRGLDHSVLFDVAAVVAMKAHPVAPFRREALVRLPEVLQVVRVDQRRRRIDQAVIG